MGGQGGGVRAVGEPEVGVGYCRGLESRKEELRAGTENVAAIVGMAAALEENVRHMTANHQHLIYLEQIILYALDASGIDYLRNGTAPQVPGNMSLSFKGMEGEMLLHRLDLKGIEVSTGSACNSEKTEVSYVLKSIGLDEAYALGTIRISLGRYNTRRTLYHKQTQRSSP
mgnify:CR=1 FL=1